MTGLSKEKKTKIAIVILCFCEIDRHFRNYFDGNKDYILEITLQLQGYCTPPKDQTPLISRSEDG